MAEEVGAAFVSLAPSARNWSRNAEREIRREMRGRGLAVAIDPQLDQAEATRALTGRTVSLDVEVDRAQVTAALMGATAGRALTVPADVSGAQMTRATRQAIRETEATRPTVNVDVDVDRPSGFLARLFGGKATIEQDGRAIGAQLGVAAMSGLGQSAQDGVGGALGGLANNPIISTVGIALGLALGGVVAPALFAVIGGAVTSALLAGSVLGVIFAGAFVLASNPVLQEAWSGFTGRSGKVLKDAAQPLLQPLVQALDILGDAMEDIGPDLKNLFAAVAPYVPMLAEGVGGFLRAFTPRLVDAVIASGPVIEQLAWALPELGAGLGDFLAILGQAGPEAGQFIGMLVRGLADILRVLAMTFATGAQLFGLMASGFSALWSAVAYGIGLLAILGAVIVGDFGSAKRWLAEAVADLLRLFRRFFGWLPDGASSAIGGLIRLARGLPGRLKSAVGSLGNLLRQAGRNVVQGLIDGIRSRFGALISTASSMASSIRNYLPFSPAKEGPLSGSGNPFVAGQTIASMLAGGMTSRLPVVASASSSLAGAVGFGGGGGAGGVAPAAGRLTAEWVGGDGDPLVRALREFIRINFAGDPAAALGS